MPTRKTNCSPPDKKWCLDFDGTNDYVNCGNDPSLDITDAITLEAWVKVSKAGVEQWFISKDYSGTVYPYRLIYVFTNNFCFTTNGNVADINHLTGLMTPTLNEWYHVVGVYTGSKKYLYVNGVEDNSVDWVGPIDISPDYLDIGWQRANNTYHFNGSIDGVKIYNRALSAEEIRYHYNRGGPVAHWRMDEGEGSIAYDESSNNNDGALHLGSSGNLATSTAWVTGKHGSAIDFDGEDDYIDCGTDSSLDITDAITIEAWVKTDTYAGMPHIFYKGHAGLYFSMAIYHVGGKEGQLYAAFDGSIGGVNEIWSTTIVSDGAWHHCVAIYDMNGYLSMYLDGVAKGTPVDISACGNVTTSDSLYIGSYIAGASNHFNGTIDDVKIYNYARTPAQILMDYNAGFSAHLK